MKYLPTLDLSAPGLVSLLYDGKLVLQAGQWVSFSSGSRSRFLGASKHVIYAAHGEHASNNGVIRDYRHRFLANHPSPAS